MVRSSWGSRREWKVRHRDLLAQRHGVMSHNTCLGRSGQVRKISSSQGFDPWTVQPLVSRCTVWANPVRVLLCLTVHNHSNWQLNKTFLFLFLTLCMLIRQRPVPAKNITSSRIADWHIRFVRCTLSYCYWRNKMCKCGSNRAKW